MDGAGDALTANPFWRSLSSSAGIAHKEAAAIWVSDRPYLVSVESPENADSVLLA